MSERSLRGRHRLVFGILIGLAIGVLAVPATIAGAAGLKFVGIEGGTSLNKAEVSSTHRLYTSGQVTGSSGNTADVTPANQLLTAEAALSTHYISPLIVPDGGSPCGSSSYCLDIVASPPAGRALVLTSIKAGSEFTNGFADYVQMFVGGANCDAGSDVLDLPLIQEPFTVDSSGNWVNGNTSDQSFAYEPGLEIPAGKALCSYGTSYEAFQVQANGYTVPASAVTLPLAHAHHVPKLKPLVHK